MFVCTSTKLTSGHHWHSVTRELVQRSVHPVLSCPAASMISPPLRGTRQDSLSCQPTPTSDEIVGSSRYGQTLPNTDPPTGSRSRNRTARIQPCKLEQQSVIRPTRAVPDEPRVTESTVPSLEPQPVAAKRRVVGQRRITGGVRRIRISL